MTDAVKQTGKSDCPRCGAGPLGNCGYHGVETPRENCPVTHAAMTDAVTHTPRPWRVEEGTALVWGDCNPDDTSSYGMGYPVAECRVTPCASWAKGPRRYEEGEANARLIAAAPDLLEALSELLDANSYYFPEKNPWGDKARAAIAKAGGR